MSRKFLVLPLLAIAAVVVVSGGLFGSNTTFGALQDSFLCLDGVDDYASAPDGASLDLGSDLRLRETTGIVRPAFAW